MRAEAAEILAIVADTIREVVNEDWIQDHEIGPETRLREDLELESIEFVKLVEQLQARFAGRVDLIGWFAGKTLPELIGLDVGALVGAIADGYGAAAGGGDGD